MPGVRHAFRSAGGAVVEEISSAHFKNDSFYTDEAINKNQNRKSVLTYWMADWWTQLKKYFVLLMALVELVTGVESNASDNIAHFAHIGGMFVGAIYIYLRYILYLNT